VTSTLLSSFARHRLPFAALGILLVTSAGPGSSYQLSPTPDEAWQRIVAASPQRELARAWERCVANVAAVMLPQRGTVRQFQELGIGGCQEEQSRLTGALVREFGYERGNSAVAGRVSALIRNYELRSSATTNPPLPPNATERTADGWIIGRVNGRCTGYLLEQTAFGSRASILIMLPEGEFLLFRTYGGDAPALARNLRDGDTLSVTANVSRGPNFVGSFRLPLTVSVRDSGYGFWTPVTEESAGRLANANAIHFRVDIGSTAALPHAYPLTGFITALEATRRCEYH
jgi:hypothetical protein